MFDPCMVSLSNHQSPRSNVLAKYALRLACPERKPKDRFFARLASEIFLSSLQTEVFTNC
jgi:hypothetical protein